jgi:hypothetical protein
MKTLNWYEFQVFNGTHDFVLIQAPTRIEAMMVAQLCGYEDYEKEETLTPPDPVSVCDPEVYELFNCAEISWAG